MRLERAKIRLSKILDEYIGRSIIRVCRFFGLLDRMESAPATIRRILFIKFWGIGSIILSEPALRWLRNTYPAAEIHYLTLAQNTELFAMIPWVTKVYALPFANPFLVLCKSAALIRGLRKEKYDLIFDAEFFANFSALLARGAAGKCVIGFARKDGIKSHLLNVRVAFHDALHTAEQFLRLVQNHHAPKTGCPQPRLFLEENGFLASVRFSTFKPYVVMNINASPLATERRWPRERFVQLAKALLETYGFDLVLIGSESERAYVTPVERGLGYSKRVKNLAGQLNLMELAYLLKHALLLISNDSGPIHLAAAFQIPVVGFYGPETPRRYGPLMSPKLVFYRNLWCSPCMTVDNAKTVNCINHLACMKEIEISDVIKRVRRFIDNNILLELNSATETVYSGEAIHSKALSRQ